MIFIRPARNPRDHAARIRIPIGRAQPGEGGDNVHAAGIRHFERLRLALSAVAEKAKFIPQPLHRAARIEYAPLQRIADFVSQRISDGGKHARGRLCAPFSRRKEHKHARPVGDLRRARFQASLPEKRCLLVSRDARKRVFPSAVPESAHYCGARDGLRQNLPRDAEIGKKRIVPPQLFDIEEHRAGGIGVIGDERPPLRQLENEVRVDRADAEIPLRKQPSGGRTVL